MNFKKYIYIAAVALGMGMTFAACSDDDLDPNSIFDDSEGTPGLLPARADGYRIVTGWRVEDGRWVLERASWE